jgi:hypothetical protein
MGMSENQHRIIIEDAGGEAVIRVEGLEEEGSGPAYNTTLRILELLVITGIVPREETGEEEESNG